MKQKYINRILSIFNILICIFYLINVSPLGPLNSYTFGDALDISMSIVAIEGELKEMLTILLVLDIVMIIANIINIIINRKNRKMILWSIIPVIYFLDGILSHFDLEIITNSITELKLWAIIPAIAFIIALIIEIRKNRRKKNIIFYLLAIIMSIGMYFLDIFTSSIWLLIAGVMQFIYSNNTLVEESKVKKVFTTIILIIIGVTFIFAITKETMMIIKLHTVDKESVQFINQIKEKLEREKISNDVLILVNRNNKWGYINQTGKEIIPCEYDAISQISNTMCNTSFLIAQKQDNYYIISKNGTILSADNETPAPYVKGLLLNRIKEAGEIPGDAHSKNGYLFQIHLGLSSYLGINNNEPIISAYDDEDIFITPENYDYNDDYNMVYEYDLKNGYKLYIEEIENINDEETYNIQIKRNNQVINEMKDVNTTLSYTKDYTYTYSEGGLLIYTNGYIPFCNLDKQIHGYYSMKDMNAKGFTGKYRILDIIGNRIIVRDYNDISNTKDYIMDLETDEVLFVAKNISAYKQGYIIEKDNKKVAYMDNNFKQKTKEFDYIYLYTKYGVMICGDNHNNSREYSLYDLNGNKLTNYTYQAMGDEWKTVEEKEYYPLEYLFENEYYSYYYKNN